MTDQQIWLLITFAIAVFTLIIGYKLGSSKPKETKRGEESAFAMSNDELSRAIESAYQRLKSEKRTRIGNVRVTESSTPSIEHELYNKLIEVQIGRACSISMITKPKIIQWKLQ